MKWIVALAALMALITSMAHAEPLSKLTIGVPFNITSAFVCLNQQAAETTVNLVADQGDRARHNPTFTSYLANMICGRVEIEKTLVMITAVTLSREMEDGSILKVVKMVRLDGERKPLPKTLVYLITPLEIIGSGIEEHPEQQGQAL